MAQAVALKRSERRDHRSASPTSWGRRSSEFGGGQGGASGADEYCGKFRYPGVTRIILLP